MLLIWAVINLLGGAISVLPLPMLPFNPEQTLTHYGFNGLLLRHSCPSSPSLESFCAEACGQTDASRNAVDKTGRK